MRVLVTGATGFVGSHLVQHMLEHGHRVSVLIRAKRGWLDELGNVEELKGDITRPHTLESISKEYFDLVIHAAGLTRAGQIHHFYLANAIGTYNLIRALTQKGHSPGLFVYISTQAVAGPGEVSDGVPEHPINPYGESKLYGEIMIRDAHIPFLILRPPVTYGPRDMDVLRFFRIVKRGWLPSFSKGKCLSLVYVKNLVYALHFLLEKEEQGTYFLSDGSYTWWEIAEVAARIMGVKLRSFPLHPGVLRPLSEVSELYRCMTKRPVLLSKEKLGEMMEDVWICHPSRLSALGFTPPVRLHDALEETIQWYKINGYL